MMVTPIAGPSVMLGPNGQSGYDMSSTSSGGMSLGSKIGLGIGALAAGYGATKLFGAARRW